MGVVADVRCSVPLGFGFLLLFLLVVVAGSSLLWLQPDGTLPVVSVGKLINFTYH